MLFFRATSHKVSPFFTVYHCCGAEIFLPFFKSKLELTSPSTATSNTFSRTFVEVSVHFIFFGLALSKWKKNFLTSFEKGPRLKAIELFKNIRFYLKLFSDIFKSRFSSSDSVGLIFTCSKVTRNSCATI